MWVCVGLADLAAPHAPSADARLHFNYVLHVGLARILPPLSVRTQLCKRPARRMPAHDSLQFECGRLCRQCTQQSGFLRRVAGCNLDKRRVPAVLQQLGLQKHAMHPVGINNQTRSTFSTSLAMYVAHLALSTAFLPLTSICSRRAIAAYCPACKPRLRIQFDVSVYLTHRWLTMHC